MSFVNLLIIKNRRIVFLREHYRKAIDMLEKGITPLLSADAGYLVVDFDSKIILDCQDCFSLTDISKGELKRKLKDMGIYFFPKI